MVYEYRKEVNALLGVPQPGVLKCHGIPFDEKMKGPHHQLAAQFARGRELEA